MFNDNERVAVFIDGANLYSASRTLGFDVDYKSLHAFFRNKAYIVRLFYYTAVLETEEYTPLKPLVDWLGYNGYTVVTKPAKEFTDSTGRRRVKGNMDIELAIDMLEMAPHVNHIVLFSGDGDFRRLIEAVQRKGVRVTVVSTIKTQPVLIADELRRQCDQFVDLADIMGEFTRRVVPPREHGPGRDMARDRAEGVSASGRTFTVETVGGPRATPDAPWRGVPDPETP
nr:NYN domain-containing protein [Elioraea sp.]